MIGVPVQYANIIAIRTIKIDEVVKTVAAQLSTLQGYCVVLCVDECIEEADARELYKISLSRDRYKEMQLFVEYDTLWRCGDYCLYAILEEFPLVKKIWMIEPDVYMNGDLAALIKRVDDVGAALDLVVIRFAEANPNAPWQETMTPFSSDVYICQYPLLAITARAVRRMYEARRRMSEHFASQLERDGQIKGMYPNDEAFTATICMNSGYACSDFNALGQTIYNDETFSSVIPRSRKYLSLCRHNNMIYHPVVTGDHFRTKVEFFIDFCRDRVDPQHLRGVISSVLDTIGHQIAIEVDYSYAEDCLRRLHHLLDSKAI